MFRKIEIWILYVVVLLGFLAIIAYGALVRHELLSRYDSFGQGSRFPSLGKIALFLAEVPTTLKNATDNDLIQTDRFPDISGFHGETLSHESYLLLSRYDGNLRESVVELVDLRSFEILHTWNPKIDYINSFVDTSNVVFETFLQDRAEDRYQIINPLILSDGSLIFQAMSSPLIRIDYCGDLTWQNQEQRFHHTIELDHEGNIWVPTHNFPYSIDEKYVGSKFGDYLDDAITKLSPDGQILFQKSISEIFIQNNMAHLLLSMGNKFENDPIHLNDIQPTLSDSQYWNRGDVFLSLRNQSMVVLYRPATNEIIWKGVGRVRHQHDIEILDDHRISIFNNNAVNSIRGHLVDGFNEVVIYDFKNSEYTNYLGDALRRHEVRTKSDGRGLILDNGDLFIEEQNYSRTLYFNANGSLQWQHVNRADDGRVYDVAWSRLLYKPSDVAMVHDILGSGECEYE